MQLRPNEIQQISEKCASFPPSEWKIEKNMRKNKRERIQLLSMSVFHKSHYKKYVYVVNVSTVVCTKCQWFWVVFHCKLITDLFPKKSWDGD